MKWTTFFTVCIIYVGVFLAAQLHPVPPAPQYSFRSVVDLTTASSQKFQASNASTRITAPSAVAPWSWSMDKLPPERLIAKLVVMDSSRNPQHEISMREIAEFEHAHGTIQPGSVVIARTSANNCPADLRGFQTEAVRFLVEGRGVYGLGSDACAERSFSRESQTIASIKGVYQLENVSGLDHAPATGAVVIVAPQKIEAGPSGPVRLLVLE